MHTDATDRSYAKTFTLPACFFYLNISNFLTFSTLRHVTDTLVPSRFLASLVKMTSGDQ